MRAAPPSRPRRARRHEPVRDRDQHDGQHAPAAAPAPASRPGQPEAVQAGGGRGRRRASPAASRRPRDQAVEHRAAHRLVPRQPGVPLRGQPGPARAAPRAVERLRDEHADRRVQERVDGQRVQAEKSVCRSAGHVRCAVPTGMHDARTTIRIHPAHRTRCPSCRRIAELPDAQGRTARSAATQRGCRNTHSSPAQESVENNVDSLFALG